MKTPEAGAAPDLHYWAAQNLQVSTQATPAAVRAAFLGKLAECHWLPPPAVQEGYEYLTRPADNKIFPSLSEQAVQEEEARLRSQVDDFAQKFFQMQPIARQARYRALAAQCAWSVNLSARLSTLSPGLEVNSRDWQDAPQAQQDLAERVCQLFALPPIERARRRWQMLEEFQASGEERQGPGSNWKFAAQALRENRPELARLEAGFIDELAQTRPRREFGRGRIPQVVNRQFVSNGNQTGKGSAGTWGIWVAVISIGIGVLRGIMGGGGTSTPPRQQQPPFDMQKFRNDKWPQPNVPANDNLRKLREQQKLDPKGPVHPPIPGKADVDPPFKDEVPRPDPNRNR